MKLIKPGPLFTKEEISNLIGADFQTSIKDFSISTDSREVSENQIFVPLKGEKFDGHNFINEILSTLKNTISICEKSKLQKIDHKHRQRLLVVDNALNSYHLLANHYRKKVDPIVIAITGSSGKTTTKELISAVLSVKYKVHKTEGNNNNEYGVPKTILEMPKDTEVLVLELAMRAKGEIRTLSKIAEPDIAVITNIGTAHIGKLGSVKNILEAKSEIIESLNKDGLLIANNDRKLVQHLKKIWRGKLATFNLDQVSYVNFEGNKTSFGITFKDMIHEEYTIKAIGKTQILNSLSAVLLAKYLDLSRAEIQKGLFSFEIPNGRGNIIELGGKIFLVDESYNANPDSVKAAVCNVIDGFKDYKKILVLGELAELGKYEEELLLDLRKWLVDKPLDKILFIGDKMDGLGFSHANNIETCIEVLKREIKPPVVILVKGSRIAGLEKLVEQLKNMRSKA